MCLVLWDKILGCKVVGVWWFLFVEIYYWLEEWIGCLDELEFVEVEGVLYCCDIVLIVDLLYLDELFFFNVVVVLLLLRSCGLLIDEIC